MLFTLGIVAYGAALVFTLPAARLPGARASGSPAPRRCGRT